MKNILFVFFLIIPFLTFSQNEADQKRIIRNQSNSIPSTTPSQSSSQQYNSGFPTPTFEFEQKKFERSRRSQPQIFNNEKNLVKNFLKGIPFKHIVVMIAVPTKHSSNGHVQIKLLR